MIHFGSSCLLFLKSNDSNIISDITIVNHNHEKIAFNFFSCLGWIQEDRSGNSFAGGNGHSAKIVTFNKLTGDVYEEKPTFGTSQSTYRAAKIKCKRITFSFCFEDVVTLVHHLEVDLVVIIASVRLLLIASNVANTHAQ